jgi:Icc-related predicted phosphoesterase
MKIIATSDLHGAQPDIKPCDLLIIAGDTVGRPTAVEYNRFYKWVAEQPAKDVVIVGGNHDSDLLYTHPSAKKYHLLFNETVTIGGISIFGSPYSKPFNNWNFMPSDDVRFDAYMMMPYKVHILVTHGPEYMILDMARYNDYCGDRVLAKVMNAKIPYIHIFGHIHEGFGYTNITGVHSYNVSYLDGRYEKTRQPVEINLDSNGKIK